VTDLAGAFDAGDDWKCATTAVDEFLAYLGVRRDMGAHCHDKKFLLLTSCDGSFKPPLDVIAIGERCACVQ
jgi:hypothetical protein